MERLNTFLGRHLWAQVMLVVLLGRAVSTLMSPGEPALVVSARSAVTSVGAVAVLLVLTWQGGRKARRLCEVRETLRGSTGGAGAGGEAPEERWPRRPSHDGWSALHGRTGTLLTVGRAREAAFAHRRAERAQRGGGIRSVSFPG
ncbi:hypothetical protein [Streptomyces sp. NPDC005009]